MQRTDVLQSRVLGVAALVIAVVLVAIGVQQASMRVGEVASSVIVPLAVAVMLGGLVLAAGLHLGRRVAAGDRRTPYW